MPVSGNNKNRRIIVWHHKVYHIRIFLILFIGLKNQERNEVQNKWTVGEVSVIAATCSFGMGVDKPTVRYIQIITNGLCVHVLNYLNNL